MAVDSTYALTRRRGKLATVTRMTGESFNRETGANTLTEVVTTVRWMVKEQTRYSTLVRATATQQQVGEVTFIMWLPDVDAVFTTLDTEDFITYQGNRFDVVTAEVFENDKALVVTATALRGGAR